MKFILGKKLNMTRTFTQNGVVVPVTVVKAGPVKVTQIKSAEGDDGYNAVQVGYGGKKRLSKALQGHFKESGNFAFTREFKIPKTEDYRLGQELTVEQFETGEFVTVTAFSKGRGFAGVMKRHGFKGAPASHGHDHPRAAGSIGQMYPQHVLKGKRMAGHMGMQKVSVSNLEVMAIDTDRNLLFVKGALPGPNGGLVKVVLANKKKRVES